MKKGGEMRKTVSKAASLALALSLVLFVLSGLLAAFGGERTTAHADDEESAFIYDEELSKWMYPMFLDFDSGNDMLGTWDVYLCFDECPTSTPKYFDVHPSGVLVDWPECYSSSASFISPGIDDAYFTYGVDAKGVDASQYFVKSTVSSSNVELRKTARDAEDKGDRIFFEITKQSEYAKSKVRLTLGGWKQSKTDNVVSKSEPVDSSYVSYSFVVDLTPPEFEQGEEYSSEVSVSVADEVAGIEAIFAKGPGDENFSVAKECGGATSATYTLPAGSEEGEWQFFAADLCGNCSEVYSVYLDTTSPVITMEETENSFHLTATDSSGAPCAIIDEQGNEYDGELYVAKDFIGTKLFWARDGAGNLSDPFEVSIVLLYPEGALLWDEHEAPYFIWDDPGGMAMLDGEPYESGTLITEEGEHFIEFQTSEGEVHEYSFEVKHFYYESYREDATCQAEGYVRYDCAHCTDFYTETLERLEHSFVSYEATATCEEGAYIRYTCTKCGVSYTIELSSPTGHVYIPTTTTATCTSPGGTTYTCMYCGDSYTVGDGVLAEHEYVTERIVSPTCEEQGYRVLVCANCGEERRDMIAALGHEWNLTGETKDSDGYIVRTYRCSVCGATRVQTLSDTADSTARAIIDLFERYQKYVWWILLAVAGVWSLFMGIRYALASRDEEKEKAKRTIVNYLVGLVVIAVILVAAPYLVYGIALLLA